MLGEDEDNTNITSVNTSLIFNSEHFTEILGSYLDIGSSFRATAKVESHYSVWADVCQRFEKLEKLSKLWWRSRVPEGHLLESHLDRLVS